MTKPWCEPRSFYLKSSLSRITHVFALINDSDRGSVNQVSVETDHGAERELVRVEPVVPRELDARTTHHAVVDALVSPRLTDLLR